MWIYEKRLQYPVKITQTNPKLAQVIISQFGGPDGELAASMRYLSQRYTMPYKEVTGILTDIGNEGLLLHTPSLWESVSCRFLQLLCFFKSFNFSRTKIHFCGSKFNFTSTRWSG